jgi:hypothetical protein
VKKWGYRRKNVLGERGEFGVGRLFGIGVAG